MKHIRLGKHCLFKPQVRTRDGKLWVSLSPGAIDPGPWGAKGAEEVNRAQTAMNMMERTSGSQIPRDSSFYCPRAKVYRVLRVTVGMG